MNLPTRSRKPLSLLTFFSASLLSPFAFGAEENPDKPEPEPVKVDVADEATLRKYLSEKYLPEGGTEGKDETYYYNAELTLTGDFSVDTTLVIPPPAEKPPEGGEEGGKAEEPPAEPAPPKTGAIEVLASGSKIFGNGKTLSSTELTLDQKGSGDLFFLGSGSLFVENITFAGTTDETKKTGRVFTTANGTAFSSIIIGASTRIENRRLVADEYTNYRASGGAIASAHILDTVKLETIDTGDIVFSGNTAYGKTITYTFNEKETTEVLDASGGAIFTSGTVSITGAGLTDFRENKAISEDGLASAGAIFVSNAKLNADGSPSSTTYPGSVDGQTEFGLRVSETTLSFLNNSAQGVSARGGAVVVAGGYFDTEKSDVFFTSNSIRNAERVTPPPEEGEEEKPAPEKEEETFSSLGGGALLISDGGRATFDETTTLDFGANTAEGISALERASLSGGALVVSDARFAIAGTTRFSGNSVVANAKGSTAWGGAGYFTGSLKKVVGEDGEPTQEHTANITLAGRIDVVSNEVIANALSAEKITGTGDNEKTEIIESSATGGGFVFAGGKIDSADLTLERLVFNSNFAGAKTSASGGALASVSDVTEMTLQATEIFEFISNNATLLALATGESQTAGVEAVARGGAAFVSAGTLDLSTTVGEVLWSLNSADASAQANAFARGGALFQSGGKIKLGDTVFDNNGSFSAFGTAQGGAAYFSDSASIEFAGAVRFNSNESSALIAQGGAIYASGGTQTFSKEVTFFGNEVDAGDFNSASGTTFARGGAIFLTSNARQTFKAFTTFEGNTAEALSTGTVDPGGRRSGAAGGAIYASGTLEIAGSEFIRNWADSGNTPDGAAFGGAVYVASGKFSAQALTMTDNGAYSSKGAFGGAVYIASAGLFEVQNDFTLTGNEVSTDNDLASGGAIYSAGTARVNGTFSATGNFVNPLGRNVDVSGGALSIAGGEFTITGDSAHTISNNNVAARLGNAFGGAISTTAGFSTTAGTLSLTDNFAHSDTGSAFGGAIYMRGGKVLLTNATITNNRAQGAVSAFGGGIYIDASSAVASSLTLRGNTVISGNTSNTAGVENPNDGIYIGTGTGTEAKGAVALVFDARADIKEDEDGNITLENIETANISDKITIDKASVTFTKTGDGNLNLGAISGLNGAKLSFAFNGGNTVIDDAISVDTVFESIGVAKGATVIVESSFGDLGYKTATIAGSLTVKNGVFALADASKTTLTGTLAIENATLKILAKATIEGAGTFSVKGNSSFEFSGADAALTASSLSVGAGTLAVNNTGTLTLTDKLVFTETGDAKITLGAGSKLALAVIERTADGVNVTIDGEGTLLLYIEADEEDPPTRLSFSEFYEKIKDADGKETQELRLGSFILGKDVKIEAGISIGEGVTFSLSPDAQVEGKRNVLIKGGTLLAPNSSASAPLGLESLIVSNSDLDSTLGKAGENQVFKMLESTRPGEEEGDPPITETAALALSGKLNITETTVFIGNVALGGSSALLKGAGTVEGDILGTGTVSIENVSGNINAENGKRITLAGTVNVAGDVNVGKSDSASANAAFVFAKDANLTALNFFNYGKTTAEKASFTGAFNNAGTLIVAENSTLAFGDGTEFKNSILVEKDVVAGTIDLSALGSGIDFSAVSASGTDVTINDGSVRIDATTIKKGETLPVYGLSEEHFKDLKIEDIHDYKVDDRFVWDSVSGNLVFLGLNGEAFRGTIFGDVQRESINRTHNFMRSAQLRGSTRTLAPDLYGEHKKTSPYMRGYLEKARQRGGEVSAEIESRNKAELALAEKLNSSLVNFWAQADYLSSEQEARGGFDAYDTSVAGVLFGVSAPFKSWELGLAFTGGQEDYKTKSVETRHKIETDVYGLTGYGRYTKGWFDWSLGAAGMYASSESKRGGYSGDFDSWRLGAMTEFGATLRAQSWLALRAFAGLSVAYSYAGSFDESGSGENALSLDAGGAFGVRTNIGFSSTFLLADSLQLKLHGAWLFDLGNDTCSIDAFMPSTQTRYVIDSRENESSALELGAYLHWTFSENTSLYGGYTGTIRAGERVNALTLGVNYFF